MSKRKPHFSEREIEMLVDCVETHKYAALGKFSGPGNGSATRAEVWKSIQAELQTSTAIIRTTDELKEKNGTTSSWMQRRSPNIEPKQRKPEAGRPHHLQARLALRSLRWSVWSLWMAWMGAYIR